MGRPARLTGPVRLRDGSRVEVRFIRPDDGPRLVELFEGLSPETIYRRFLHARGVLPPAEAARYAGVDHRERDALVACAAGGDGEALLVAVARYARQDEEGAEAALVVADDYQGRGLGTTLLRRLIALVRSRGFRHLHGAVLSDNGRMLRLLRSTGYPLTIARDDGAYWTQLDLAASPA
jgi:acetyltransferase